MVRLMRWMVDAMNVIGTRPDNWWQNREDAMLQLVRRLELWAAAEAEDVVVVFEREPSPPIRSTVIEVTHARKAKRHAADDEIVRRLRLEPDPHLVLVVTSDRVLSDLARGTGATVVGSRSFRRRIDAY